MKKDWKQLLRKIRRDGYDVTAIKNGHVRVTHPTMPGVVTAPGTASDYRAILNFKAQMKRTFGWQG